MSHRRLADERETRHWSDAIEQTQRHFDRARAQPWFVIDREGDAQAILGILSATTARFTVRSSFDRVVDDYGQTTKLRALLSRAQVCCELDIGLLPSARRSSRRAHLHVRVVETTLRMRIASTRYVQLISITAVWVREVGTTPADEEPLDWTLLTNHRVETSADAQLIVHSYTTRWRIEELHKAWKSAACGVEQTQLRSHDAVVRWAVILASVAARAEQLSTWLAKSPNDLPATRSRRTRSARSSSSNAGPRSALKTSPTPCHFGRRSSLGGSPRSFVEMSVT